jgi:transglutaminase-like putative cysteine protease
MFKNFKVCIALCLIWSGASYAEYKPSSSVVSVITHLHVNKDGSSTEDMEVRKRVNTAQAIRGLGEQKISFNGTLETVEIVEAYTVRPDGSKIQVANDKIRTQDEKEEDGSSIYSDRKVTIIIFPNIEVGSQVYYKAKTVQHTPTFQGHFYWSTFFTPHRPYEEFKVYLTHDEGIDLQFDIKGANGGVVASEANDPKGSKRYFFDYKQLDAYPGESSRVGLYDFAPHIMISSFKDLAAFGKAYQVRAHEKATPTPAVRKLAQEIVGNETDQLKQARLLYNWVSHNVRYVGVYVGAGGFVPHDAQSILDNRYGDCKDHVVILESMLRAVGIDSSPALVNYGDSYLLHKLPLTSPFNHVITYLPKYKLFLDSTNDFAPFGILDDDVMDKPVLLTATGEVSRTPKTSPYTDYAVVKTKLKLLSNGSVQGASTAEMRGSMEASSRATQFGYENRDQEEIINGLLERFQERGEGSFKAGNPKDLDTPWQVVSEFELKPVVNVPGPSAMTVPVGIAPGYLREISSSTVPKARKFPASCRSVRYTENTELEFPRQLKVQRIPKSVNFKSGALHYQASYSLQGKTLTIKRQYTSNRPSSSCDASDDKNWDAISEVMQHDMRNQIYFR